MGEKRHRKPLIYFQPSTNAGLDREIILAMFAIASGVTVGLLAASGLFNWPFWGASLLFVFCLLFSRNRAAIIAAPLIFSGVRLLWGFAVYQRMTLLVASAICWAVGLGFAKVAKRRDDVLFRE